MYKPYDNICKWDPQNIYRFKKGRGRGVMVCRAVNIEAKDVSIIFIEFCKYAYILTHPK